MFLVPFWRAAASLGFGLLTGCVHTPESYPIPEQHRPFRPMGFLNKVFVSAGDLYSQDAFLGGFQPPESSAWRWTKADPELSFELDAVDRQTLVYEFVIHDRTFRDTGPLAMTFYVNERQLAREVYESPGDKRFEKAVPAEWLRSNTRVRVSIENPWRTEDGEVLGILFRRAGFVR